MKYKILILLTVLLNCTLAASPNRSCKRVRCATSSVQSAAITPVRTVVMKIDEAELLPMHHYLNKF